MTQEATDQVGTQPTAGQVQQIPVHRIVFPEGEDLSVLPLYVDWRDVVSPVADPSRRQRRRPRPQPFRRMGTTHDRRSLVVPAGKRLSLATYFNAFPAAYWREWTSLDSVRLTLTLDAPAMVDVFRSTARGSFYRIDGAIDGGDLQFDLSLRTFGDGGWLWFEVEAGDQDVRLSDAQWSVAAGSDYRERKLSVAITTFNRPDDCVGQMRRFLDSPDLLARLDQLMITDQGSKKVRDADGFGEAADRLGEQFRLIEQGNLGGSGGFARGMREGARREQTDFVMLMDDDVIVETEGILRALNFAEFTSHPTLVGGHMLSLNERATLQNFGEVVNLDAMAYEPVSPELESLNFAAYPLRAVKEFHRRWDVDYNAWWMCLIPKQVITEIGLSLPVFIKWDDAEYGLRAAAHGYRTVTLPGAAVWHMPWTEKDDSTDWQAYFHQRNRWVAGLLYSPYPQGGTLPRISFAIDVRHLISMQYSTVELRLQALEDVLTGPDHLHQGLPTINAQVRALRSGFTDAKVISDTTAYPAVRRSRPAPRRRAAEPTSLFALGAKAAAASLRAVTGVPAAAVEHPEARIASADAKWWRLGTENSALVSTADGSGASFYVRDRRSFVSMLVRSLRLHLRLLVHWRRLAGAYRAALGQVVSPTAWDSTFD